MQKTSPYFFSADLIRVIAIILVVLIHVFSEFLNYPKVLGSVDWWIADIVNAGARIAVPLFIMLSGMLILHTEKTYTLKEFFSKRVSKIGIPLLAWPVVYFAFKTWLNKTPFTLHSIIIDYINLNIYYHLYYIYVIVALYLLTPVIKIVITNSEKSTKKYFFFLTAFFSLSLTASIYFLQSNINLSTIFTVFIPFLGYYLAGDYFRHKKVNKKETYFYIFSFIVLTLIAALGTWWHMNYLQDVKLGKNVVDYGKYFYDYTGITVALMSLIAFILCNNLPRDIIPAKNNKFSKLLLSIAAASFGIYLIHPLILEFSNRILQIPFEALPIPLWIFLFIKMFGILITSYGIVLLIKRIPYLKLLV